jgi:hypothetical protein
MVFIVLYPLFFVLVYIFGVQKIEILFLLVLYSIFSLPLTNLQAKFSTTS